MSKEVTILKDYWDFHSGRIQIVTGLFFATVSILAIWLIADNNIANAVNHQYNFSLINIYDNAQSTFITSALRTLDASYLTVPRLILHMLIGYIVGLTAFEISKIYGNRWGVMHSVWAALLYIVCPTTVILIYSGDGLAILLGALFSTSSIYLDFRYRYLDEESYLIGSAVCLTVSMGFDVVSGLTALSGILLSRIILHKLKRKEISAEFKLSYLALILPPLFIVLQNDGMRNGLISAKGMEALLSGLASSPEHLIAHSKSLLIIFLIAIISLVSVTTIRVIAGTVWLRPLIFLAIWLLTNFLIASFYICGAHYLADSSISAAALIFYCSTPLTIMLCLMALPAIDAVNKLTSVILSVIGCVCLSFLFVFWGTEMYGAQSKQIKIQDQFNQYEKIAKQEALAYPEKNLVLVGMPNSVFDYIKDHKMHLSQKRMENLFEAIKSTRGKGFALVNSLGFQHSALDSKTGTVYLKWIDNKGTFVPIDYKGRYNFSMLFNKEAIKDIQVSPESIAVLEQTSFGQADFNTPLVEFLDNSLRVTAGNTAAIIWLPDIILNPAQSSKLSIDAKISDNGIKNKASAIPSAQIIESLRTTKLSLVWTTTDINEPCEVEILQKNDNELVADLYKHPQWMSAPAITRLGLKLSPGKYSITIIKLAFNK